MSLRFFADHCVPRSVVDSIRLASHDVLKLADCIPTDSDDEVVSIIKGSCFWSKSIEYEFANECLKPKRFPKGRRVRSRPWRAEFRSMHVAA
jgi:hypothetical protein